ncbi:MAG: hypothetical protein IKP19_08340, partial [Oscillospiraceae bacterium]|nr:hypothetical protein [Oscillospiraceae bacterium]
SLNYVILCCGKVLFHTLILPQTETPANPFFGESWCLCFYGAILQRALQLLLQAQFAAAFLRPRLVPCGGQGSGRPTQNRAAFPWGALLRPRIYLKKIRICT